jgi:hypothetical protein
VSACFYETLTNSKDCSKNTIISVPAFLVSYGQFYPVYIHGPLLEQLSGSQAAFKTTFGVKDGYRNAEQAS